MASIGKLNKERGYRLENAAVKMARKYGLCGKRCWGSDGRSMGLTKNADIVVEGMPFQCKSRQEIAGYVLPEKDVEGQIIQQRGGGPFVVLPLSRYYELLSALRHHETDEGGTP